MIERCGMRLVDVQMNAVNGGSFAVTACKESAKYESNKPVIDWLLKQEDVIGLKPVKPYLDFAERVFQHRTNPTDLIESLVADGKKS
jgi:hypothetical protein